VPEGDDIVANGEFVGSRDVRTGYLSGPGFEDATVRYNVVDGIAIFDGCIDMGPAEEVAAYAEAKRAASSRQADAGGSGPGSPGSGGAGAAAAAAGDGASADGAAQAQAPPIEMFGVGLRPDSSFLWTNGVVPFTVDDDLPNAARITQAIAHIHANTGIRWVARTNEANRVRFVRNPNADWSSSAIGMRGGEQLIRISDGATMGTVVHECLHCLGVLHEQSRCDRDQFVTINYQNVREGFESNFDRFCDGYRDYFDYDYGSIMHYPATAFTTNGQPTIVPVQSGVTLGQRTGMSVIDRLTVAEMYSRFTGHGHTGVWRAGSGRYGLWVNAPWDSFRAKWQEWAGQGLRLVDIHVRRVGNQNRYSGVWLPGTGAYALWANASWDSFRGKWQELSGQGLRLVDLHVLRVGGEDRYSGVFLPGSGGYALWVNATWDSFRAKWQEWARQGLRLVDINVQHVAGQERYSGVWLAGTGGYGLWANASWASFRAKWQEWAGRGLRLVDVAVHQSGGGLRYSGAFLPGTDAYYLWANVPWESLRARWEQLAAQGLRLIDYEFTEMPAADVAALDAAGTPVPQVAADVPEGAGGIFDDAGPLGVRALEPAGGGDGGREVVTTPAAGDTGQGGVHLGGDAAALAVAGAEDGLGGFVPAGEPAPAAVTAAAGPDGDGGAVFGEPAGAAPGDGNGVGEAVAAAPTNGGAEAPAATA